MIRPVRKPRGGGVSIGNIAAKLDNAFVSSGFEKNFTGTTPPAPVVETPPVVVAEQQIQVIQTRRGNTKRVKTNYQGKICRFGKIIERNHLWKIDICEEYDELYYMIVSAMRIILCF